METEYSGFGGQFYTCRWTGSLLHLLRSTQIYDTIQNVNISYMILETI